MTAVLAADCVGKAYGERKILTAASIHCQAGAVTALLGRNGAGKSTLLKIAAGWIAPDYGVVRFKGKSYMGVAPTDAEMLSHAFRTLAGHGCAVVVTGHEVPTLANVADRVVWCTAGTTYDLGTPEQASAEWRFQREYLGWT